jgi:glycosyltransferase involved in cell wall biosynthesis
VLLAGDYAAPLGGAEIAQLALRDGLRARGHEVHVFASSAIEAPPEARPEHVCFGTTSRWRTLLQTANPLALRGLRRAITEFRPDVVHLGLFLTQLSPLVLRALRNVPAVYQVHWLRPICPTGLRWLPDGTTCHAEVGRACLRCLPLRDWLPLMVQMGLWRRWAGVLDAVVANSAFARDRLEGAGLPVSDVVVPGLCAPPPRPRLGPVPLVAFAGRLVPEKGADVLLQAFGRVAPLIPAARLLLLGEGPERERLQRLAAELGITSRVELRGHLARPEAERALAQAWVQVVPSRVEECFGLAAAEALLRGTALVASRIGALPEVAGDDARLVPPSDPVALASVLLELLGDRDACESLGARGRLAALPRFAASRQVEEFLAVYRRVIGEG